MFDIVKHLAVPESVNIPERLYHYTSQQGLVGILSSRALWSTRIQYLNDSTEFRYAYGLLQNAIRSRERFDAFKSKLVVDKILNVMSRAFELAHNEHVHVACFSENGDALNLWRGYCAQGRGFSIGFLTDQLADAAGRSHSFIGRCNYASQKQSEFVNQLVDDFFDRAFKAKEEGADTTGMGHRFFNDCLLLASLLKHPSFGEEGEWRIVTTPLPDTSDQIGVRQGRIVLIPYFRFALVQPNEKLNLEIVVGPTPEPDLSMDSVRTLLEIYGCMGTVRASTVPYREI